MKRVLVSLSDGVSAEAVVVATVGDEVFLRFVDDALARLYHDENVTTDGKRVRQNFRSLYRSAFEAVVTGSGGSRRSPPR